MKRRLHQCSSNYVHVHHLPTASPSYATPPLLLFLPLGNLPTSSHTVLSPCICTYEWFLTTLMYPHHVYVPHPPLLLTMLMYPTHLYIHHICCCTSTHHASVPHPPLHLYVPCYSPHLFPMPTSIIPCYSPRSCTSLLVPHHPVSPPPRPLLLNCFTHPYIYPHE